MKIGNLEITDLFIGETQVDKAFLGEVQVYPTDVHDYLTFTAKQANSTVKGNLNHSTSIEYSYDGETWNDANNVTITLANVGDSVMYRGEANGSTSSYSSSFSMTGKIAASGSVMSMLHKDPDDKVIDMNNAFNYMFLNCSSLTSAPELPATTLANNCYKTMFKGCSSLTTAPSLPTTTLVGYCYNSMFNGCSSLTTAPELPATTLATLCYQSMFQGCSSLTSAPELPATTLVNGCYSNMFYGCTSLTSAPELPSTTLASSCYQAMFSGCSSLNDVTVHATSWNTSYTNNWLSGVAATGTLHNLGGATDIPTDSASGCPTGWNVVTPHVH